MDKIQSITKSLPSVLFIILGLFLGFNAIEKSYNRQLDAHKYKIINTNFVTAADRDRQLDCLTKNIYFEAATEPFEGKVAVAQVTINRANSGSFPDDICKVVYQKNIIYEKVICQFSWYCERGGVVRNVNNELYRESNVVAKKVLLEGFRLDSLNQALYYHADYVNPNWRREKIIKIGHHIFYR